LLNDVAPGPTKSNSKGEVPTRLVQRLAADDVAAVALVINPAIARPARPPVRTADPSVPDMGMYLLPERR